MPPNYAAFDLAASKAVDVVQGELLRFTPKLKGDNWSRGLDSGRPVMEVVGTFIDGKTKVGFADGDRHQSSFAARTSQQEAFASVDKTNFTGAVYPVKGDMVETIDQTPVRAFEIVDVYRDGDARLAFALVGK